MKISEAMRIIDGMPRVANRERGFMVGFEWADGHLLTSDHFPDKHAGEPLIPSFESAIQLAEQFAQRTVHLPMRAGYRRPVNIRVLYSDFTPVDGKVFNKR